ncbi:unnamed protein product, partial [Ectocarpus sp. 12 AP-2014]
TRSFARRTGIRVVPKTRLGRGTWLLLGPACALASISRIAHRVFQTRQKTATEQQQQPRRDDEDDDDYDNQKNPQQYSTFHDILELRALRMATKTHGDNNNKEKTNLRR